MSNIVKFINNLNTHSIASIFKSYKKLIRYLIENSITLSLEDSFDILSSSHNAKTIVETIKMNYKDEISIPSCVENLFIANDIMNDKDYGTIPYENSKDIDLLELYLLNLPSPLSNDKLNELLSRKNKDKESSNIIITHYLRLVVYFAKYYERNGISLLDLIQEGNVALVEAVNKFDSDINTDFNKFVSIYIRGYILDYIYEKNELIKIPKNINILKDKINKIKCEKDDVSIKDISNIIKVSIKKIESINSLPSVCSLEECYNEEISTEEEIIDNILRQEACEILFSEPKLSKKDKEILLLRYGFKDGKVHSLIELSKRYNMTKEGIRYIENKWINIFTRNVKARKIYQSVNDNDEISVGMILKYGLSNDK